MMDWIHHGGVISTISPHFKGSHVTQLLRYNFSSDYNTHSPVSVSVPSGAVSWLGVWALGLVLLSRPLRLVTTNQSTENPGLWLAGQKCNFPSQCKFIMFQSISTLTCWPFSSVLQLITGWFYLLGEEFGWSKHLSLKSPEEERAEKMAAGELKMLMYSQLIGSLTLWVCSRKLHVTWHVNSEVNKCITSTKYKETGPLSSIQTRDTLTC